MKIWPWHWRHSIVVQWQCFCSLQFSISQIHRRSAYVMIWQTISKCRGTNYFHAVLPWCWSCDAVECECYQHRASTIKTQPAKQSTHARSAAQLLPLSPIIIVPSWGMRTTTFFCFVSLCVCVCGCRNEICKRQMHAPFMHVSTLTIFTATEIFLFKSQMTILEQWIFCSPVCWPRIISFGLFGRVHSCCAEGKSWLVG